MEDMKSKGVRITRILKEDTKVDAPKSKPKPEPIKPVEVVDIPKEEIFKKEILKEDISTHERPPEKKLYSTPQVRSSSGGLRKRFVVLLGLVLFIGGVYFLCNLLQNANVTIVAKQQSFNLSNTSFAASNDQSAPVHFELMIVSNEEYKDVTLTESQNVSTKAHGEVTFFNENSTKAQNLAIHTFISDSKGKTYQTDKAVSIPGYKTVNGKIVAGQVSVGITAFLAGDTYNGAPSDFTINGFKGTTKFKKIYAKLKTPLTGGVQGLAYALNPNDKGTINAFAQSTFKSNLLKKVDAQVPEGYILYPNALDFSYSTETDTLFPSPKAKVKTSGTVASIILKEKDLSNAIIKNSLPGITDKELGEINIPDISKLTFSFKDSNQSITKDVKSFSFNLSGTANAIWTPDITALQSSIVGVRKADLITIFKSDPGIASASAKIFPPWQSYLPSNTSKIHIHLK